MCGRTLSYSIPQFCSIGADVNARGDDCLTPLHFAAQHGTPENIQVIIDSGADVSLTLDE